MIFDLYATWDFLLSNCLMGFPFSELEKTWHGSKGLFLTMILGYFFGIQVEMSYWQSVCYEEVKAGDKRKSYAHRCHRKLKENR